MQTHTRPERASESVVAWRRDQLARAGVAVPLAARLARDPRYDLHELLDLLGRGCPVELAVRILSPPEEVGAA